MVDAVSVLKSSNLRTYYSLRKDDTIISEMSRLMNDKRLKNSSNDLKQFDGLIIM